MRITLKAASTLDGKIATAQGRSRWITGEESRQKAHELRSEHDAILVGVNTVIADNPRLTTRNIAHGKSPIRVILDSTGRTPLKSECLADDGVPVIIVTGCQCSAEKIQRLRQLPNARVLQAPTPLPELKWLLPQLAEFQITSLLVEGGSRVHASFLKEGIVNQLVLFLAPQVIGGQNALSWCGELGVVELSQSPQFRMDSFQPLGKDLMICASFPGASL